MFEALPFTAKLNKMVSDQIVPYYLLLLKSICITVPEAPTDVKALVMGAEAILVSWRPPAQPNGVILQYTVYVKSEAIEGDPKSHKIPPYQMSYEASGLEINKQYEFWVTASTNIGEGQQSKSIVAMPSDKGIQS